MAVQDEKRAYEFTMGFISSSDKYRRQYIDKWQEILANFMVDPSHGSGQGYSANSSTITTPYRQGRIYSGSKRSVVLKDPETHKAVMTYAAKLVRALFGSREREYIKARPVGLEDAAEKAPTVSRLLKYELSRPGAFRTWVEAIIDMLLFGTSIVEVSWEYCEREMPVRTVSSEQGIELESFSRMKIPVYDDVKISPIDVVDFYPDPSRYRLDDMAGAAKRFKMNAIEANNKAQQGIYDKEAVGRAVANLGKQSSMPMPKDDFRVGIDRPTDTMAHSDFREMICYEYWGEVPWDDSYGSSRRVVTVMNNVVVRNDPWPLADPHLPWYSLIINPVQGRFYGISPAEVIRYDQDFADAMKILLAEAVLRQVHPPIAYDSDADFDVAKLREWKADLPIAVRGGPSAIGTLRYDANVSNGFSMLTGLKMSMQEASGALGGIQGEPGPDRESATGAAQRVQMAMDRPELAGMLIENDCLPQVGLAVLRRCQQFLDTEGLRNRIGELPEPVWIGSIMGDFDIEFVGSRMSMSRSEKLQSFDRLTAMAGAVPPLQAMIPWDQIARELVGDVLQLPEVAAKMQDPQMVMQNMAMMQMLGQNGGAAQNGVPTSPEPAGMIPAQASGSTG
jgi:hypothetical protein